MSQCGFARLCEMYSVLFQSPNSPFEQSQYVQDLVKMYPDRDNGILHLSLIRRLFSVPTPLLSLQSVTAADQQVKSAGDGQARDERVNPTRASLCQMLTDSIQFTPTLVGYIFSKEQLTSFSACKAICAVLTQQGYVADQNKQGECLNSVLSLVDKAVLCSHVSVYLFQLCADTIKHARKSPLNSTAADILLGSLTVLRRHWSRVLHEYSVSNNPPLHQTADTDNCNHVSDAIHFTQGQTRMASAAKPTSPPSVRHKEIERGFGEFLSLTVEILRLCHFIALSDCTKQIEIESESDFSSFGKLQLVVDDFKQIIVCNLCTLTYLVNKCETETLFVVKRLLDILLNTSLSLLQSHPPTMTASHSHPPSITASLSHPPSITTSQSYPPISTAAQSHTPIVTASQSHPPILTSSQSHTSESHPPILTASQSHTPIVTTSQSHSPSITASQPNLVSPIQASLSSHPQVMKAQRVAPSPHHHTLSLSPSSPSSLLAVIHDCLNTLIRNSALVSTFQFWMVEASLSMQELPPGSESVRHLPITVPHIYSSPVLPGESVSIESGLKYTVMRKAVLALLEFVAIACTENGRHSHKDLFNSDKLLQTVVKWAEQMFPPSFSSILNGLLQDDVESPLLGFLRLVFFKLLTEQDNCLVRALSACLTVHRVFVMETSDSYISLDTPTLDVGLQVFNVHTFFVLFLSSIGFDSTVLVDFIISPETKFSEFFILYLETCCIEKKHSLNFNYDLHSACSELDIVDEYLDMEPTESEDAEEEIDPLPRHSTDSHTNAPSVHTIEQCLGDGVRENKTSLQCEKDMTSWPNWIRDEFSSSSTDSPHFTKITSNHLQDTVVTDNQSGRDPYMCVELEEHLQTSKPDVEFLGPAIKRRKLNQQDQNLVMESRCPSDDPLPIHVSELPVCHTSKAANNSEGVLLSRLNPSSRCSVSAYSSESMASQHIGANERSSPITSGHNDMKFHTSSGANEKCFHESSDRDEIIGFSPFTSSDPIERGSPLSSSPPVETLVKVLLCFIEVRNLLSRSRVNDLLSLEHNNTRTIIYSVDTLETLYSGLLAADLYH